MQLIDTSVQFQDGDHDGRLVIQRKQDITREYLESLRESRDNSMGKPSGELHRVASIPVSVYETWLRQGYDAQKEPIRKTLAKLRAEHLDAFITTNKQI